MRILFILPRVYPFVTGGAEIFHYYLLLELAKSNKIGYISLDNIKKSEIIFHRVYNIKPMRLFLPVQTIILLLWYRKKYDIFHLNYSYGSWLHWFYYPILNKYFGVEYCITLHDGTLAKWDKPRIFRNVFNKARFVVAVSERLKLGFEQRCDREIIYLPPLIPLKKCTVEKSKLLRKHGFSEFDRVFLFVGSLKDLKRPNVIIEAINLFSKEWLYQNSIKIAFVGGGLLKDEMVSLIAKYELEDFIKIFGRIEKEKVNNFYKLASYYLITSTHEGTSMSLIEAMYNKLPIIASNAPGISDIIINEKNGLLFDLDDANHLFTQIKRLVTDAELATKLSKKAYQDYMDNFRVDIMLSKYNDLYSS